MRARITSSDGARARRRCAPCRRLESGRARRGGIAGVHLCRADDEGSRIETAEKKASAQDTVA